MKQRVCFFSRIRFTALLMALLLWMGLLPGIAYAEGEPTEVDPKDIYAIGFVLMDADTGQVLLSNEPHKQIYMASTAKVMTALLLLESGQDLDEEYTCGNEVKNGFTSASSLMGLEVGATVTYRDLLYGLMLVSGNDAAAAIAVGQAGSISEFVNWMNERAEQIGMTNTHFMNPHGIDNAEQYSTAYDMALLAREAMKNETFREVVSTKTYTVPANNKMAEKELRTSNVLLNPNPKYADYNYEYCTGIKTGYTSWAKGCLLASATKDGRNLIVSIMGDDTRMHNYDGWMRFEDSVTLFEYGFSLPEIDLKDAVNACEPSADIPGFLGRTALVPVLSEDSIPFFSTPETISAMQEEGFHLSSTVTLREDLPETIDADTIVGTITYTYQDIPVFTCDARVDPAVFSAASPSPTPTTPSGDDTEEPLPDRSLTRTFTIGLLVVALVSTFVILIMFITAPYRRRRQREKKAQLQKRLMQKRNRYR